MGTIPAGQFKQRCLALIDDVAETHRELIITKRGKPLARLVPMESSADHEREVLMKLRAQMKLPANEEDLLEPSSKHGKWGDGRLPK